VAVTNCLHTPCNVAAHHYHYHKSRDLLAGVHGIIILKLIYKTRVLEFVLYSSGFGLCPEVYFCDQDNDPLGFIKGRDFLD